MYRRPCSPDPPSLPPPQTAKAEDKLARRLQRRTEGDEDDIDAILASFKLSDAAKTAVTVTEDVPAPSPRACCSLTVNPGQVGTGGEGARRR